MGRRDSYASQTMAMGYGPDCYRNCMYFSVICLWRQALVVVWSTGEETSRVLAFLSINSLTRKMQDTFLEYILKVKHA